MTGPSPIAQDLVAGLRNGDERALEQIFRSRYDSIASEATRKLDDAGAAPRVVERVFAQVWGERERLDSPDAFENYLKTALHDVAAKELKRKAMAQRLANLEGGKASNAKHQKAGPTNMEEAWTHLNGALHATVDTHAKEEAAAQAKHAAASHIGHIADRKFPVAGVVIGVVALAIALGGVAYLNVFTADRGVVAAIESPDAAELKSEVAQRGNVTLDDGTAVSLGPQTKVRVAKGFNKDNRAVKVEGAASFTVAKKALPFRVRTLSSFIDATGTAFDVRAYPQDGRAIVRVREGSVGIKTGNAEPIPLAKGAGAAIDSAGKVTPLSAADVDELFAWQDGRLAFTNKPLRQVLPEIEKWYGYHIATVDTTILGRTVTMTVSLDSVKAMVSTLEKASTLKFGYVGPNMVLYDEKNPPKGIR